MLGAGGVHVWIAELDRADSRTVLRQLLAAYLDADPASLSFGTSEHGKPHLAGERHKLRFNLSHSGSLCLYAVALHVEVGVDVELCGHRGDVLAVAGRAFGPGVRAQLAEFDERRREREFLELWTLHEARLKCLGTGLGAGTDERRRARCWSRRLDVGGRGIAALAVSRQPSSVCVWRYPRALRA